MTTNKRRYRVLVILISVTLLLLMADSAWAADFRFPSLNIDIDNGGTPGETPLLLNIIFLLTVLSLAPAILTLMTSFTRLTIVFSFLRHALGTQQTPSNQIIAGLAGQTLYLQALVLKGAGGELSNAVATRICP